MEYKFASVVGYILGVLVVLVLAGICLKPIRYIMKILANSILGALCLVIINLAGHIVNIHIGVNPFTAVAVGALGIPGVVGLLILQIFY